MKLAVGMVMIRGAIINGENHSGHMCLGPRCRSFCPVIPFHHDDPYEIALSPYKWNCAQNGHDFFF